MVMRSGAVTLLLLVIGLSTGCSRSMQVPSRPIPRVLSEDSPFHLRGLATGDAWLRHFLMQNDPASALEIFESPADRPTSDPLLLALNQAIVHRQAGDFAASNEQLEWADREAERRHVRSASQTAASFLVSDRVLSYTPTATERAMIPYYRTMNYLDLGDVDAAAVEARRMSALLSGANGDALRRCRGDAMLNHLAGLVFERAGEWNDAIVSLRRAEADYGVCASAGLIAPDVGLTTDLIRVASAAGLNELADSLTSLHPDAVRPLGADSAEVILFVERGFIAHRAEETLHVPLYDDDLEGLESDDDDRIAEVAANAIARLARNAGDRARWGASWDDDPGVQVGQALEGAHILRLAWPTIFGTVRGTPSIGQRLTIGGSAVSASPVGNLSALAVAELEAEQPAMLARLVARSLTKYLVSREVEKKAAKQGGELLGFVAGRLMNIAANETERADTRSWTLLPAEIQIVRRRVPVGEVAVGGVEPAIDGGRSKMPLADADPTPTLTGAGVGDSEVSKNSGSFALTDGDSEAFDSDDDDPLVAGERERPMPVGSHGAASDADPSDAATVASEFDESPSAVINRLLSVGAGERRIVTMSFYGDAGAVAEDEPARVENRSSSGGNGSAIVEDHSAIDEDFATVAEGVSSGGPDEPVDGSPAGESPEPAAELGTE